jgi:hypothetical protein
MFKKKGGGQHLKKKREQHRVLSTSTCVPFNIFSEPQTLNTNKIKKTTTYELLSQSSKNNKHGVLFNLEATDSYYLNDNIVFFKT